MNKDPVGEVSHADVDPMPCGNYRHEFLCDTRLAKTTELFVRARPTEWTRDELKLLAKQAGFETTCSGAIYAKVFCEEELQRSAELLFQKKWGGLPEG